MINDVDPKYWDAPSDRNHMLLIENCQPKKNPRRDDADSVKTAALKLSNSILHSCVSCSSRREAQKLFHRLMSSGRRVYRMELSAIAAGCCKASVGLAAHDQAWK